MTAFAPITLAELVDRAAAFDRAVAVTPGIDRFCSSVPWVVAAHHALMGDREPWLGTVDDGWVALARAQRPGGRYLEPLELAWGLACPLIGPDPVAVVEGLMAGLAVEPDWDLALLAGIVTGGAHHRALRACLRPGWRLGVGPSTERYVASLDGGVDGFLGRRSRNFRKAVRADQRQAEAAGIAFTPVEISVDNALACLDRVVAIERQSWKGEAGVGVDQGPMQAFYRHMITPLAATGRARLMIAQHEGVDVAFIFGGVFAGEYRGLQFSHVARYRPYGLGNVAQLAQIERLVAEGVHTYDLGTAMDYKARWAEQVVATTLYAVAR
ncbi:MAG: GNAT family N-acetyltransferase [Myxococcales bacterium]|nr:GNAT family N-acetyltransferase [Myxococcales bacterium]